MGTMADPAAMSGALLVWYDRAARALPWRVPPGSGARPDPYRVWLSEVMLQQTSVAAVAPYFHAFLARWPTVAALAAAPEAEVMAAWAGLGYYARARNLLACARAVAARGGAFPDSEAELRALPGVGAYTAAAVAAIAFDRPSVVVDGNVERVMARLHAVEEPLPAAKPRLRALAAAMTPAGRPGDHAQAVMDLGATICTPRWPACGICPLVRACAGRLAGVAEALPRRAGKAAKPVRHGIAWLAVREDGRVSTRTRPRACSAACWRCPRVRGRPSPAARRRSPARGATSGSRCATPSPTSTSAFASTARASARSPATSAPPRPRVRRCRR